MIRRLIQYTGRVQGVGFRATTRMIARGYAVTGYVKNLDDGRVELLAEGEPAEMDAFLAELRERMGYYIKSEQATNAAATGQYVAFEIAH